MVRLTSAVLAVNSRQAWVSPGYDADYNSHNTHYRVGGRWPGLVGGEKLLAIPRV